MSSNSRTIVWTAEEFGRYKAWGTAAIEQLADEEIVVPGAGGNNSVAVIAWHVVGNLVSRFTDFLISDGEKPWRNREGEFQPRAVTKAGLLERWAQGWQVLETALAALDDSHLVATVTIRGQSCLVGEALHRGLATTAYHVGQIVYVARSIRGDSWRFLSIPPGQSEAYNAAPGSEGAAAHVTRLTRG